MVLSTQEQRSTDHDMLLRIDTKLSLMDENLKNIVLLINNLESRIRKVEDNLVRMSPIPTISYEEVVRKIAELDNDVDIIKNSKNQIIAGWRAAIFIIGSIGGLISFFLVIVQFILSLYRL